MPASLNQAWLKTVRAAPDAPALIEAANGRIWTRRELDAGVADWVAATPEPLEGRLVVFSEANGAAWLRVFLGLLRSGAVAAPLDPAEPPEAQHALAEKIGASFLWSAGGFSRIGRGRSRPDGRRIVKLTSGTSGAPRALPFTDAQMLADGRQICRAMDIRPGDVNLGLIPFGHSYGLGNLVVPLIAQGTAIACPAAPLPHALAADADRWRTTVFPAVPTALQALVDSGVETERLRSLRTVISAGAPLAPELARAFRARFGIPLHNFYGSTETGGIAYDRKGDACERGLGVGTPIRGVRLAFGRGGRFTVSSPAVHTLGNPRARGGRGIHSPADFGRIGEGGNLQLLGRAGRWMKVGGRRLNPAEVERAIREIPGVGDAIVFPHPERPEVAAAVVRGTVPPEAVREHLAPRMARWKIPKKLVVVPEFPTTARGKPDMARLRALLRD